MNPFHRVMSGGGRPTFLFDDEFLANASAPLASPRTAEPGPGTVTITDTGNKFSIANGNLTWTSGTGVYDPKYVITASQTRAVGLCLTARGVIPQTTASQFQLGFYSALNITTPGRRGVFQFDITPTPDFHAVDSGGNADFVVAPNVWVAGTSYDCAVVLRSSGAFYFIKGGVFTSWSLLFFEGVSNLATVFAGLGSVSTAVGATVDSITERFLTGSLAIDNGTATVNVTASSGVTQTADADGIYSLAFTLPAGSANLVAAELRYRQQDATNYWSAYIKRNAGNTAWDFYLDKVTAGTPATQSGFPVTSVGTVAEIEVRANAAKHNTWTRVTNTWTKRGGEISDAAFQTSTTIDPIAGAGTTLGALLCFPYQAALYNALSVT